MDFSKLTANTKNYLQTQLTGIPLAYNPLLFERLDLGEILPIRSMHYTIPYHKVQEWNQNINLTAGAASLVGYGIAFKGGIMGCLLASLGGTWLNRKRNEMEIPPYPLSDDEFQAYIIWSELFLRVANHFPDETKAWWAAFNVYAQYCLSCEEGDIDQTQYDQLHQNLMATGNLLSQKFQIFIAPFSDEPADGYLLANSYFTSIFLIVFNTGLDPLAVREDRLLCMYFDDKTLFGFFKRFLFNLPSCRLMQHLPSLTH